MNTPMKTFSLVTAFLLACHPFSRAEVPAPVLAQLRADMKAGMQAKDSTVTEAQLAQEIAAFETEAGKTTGDVAASFAFTTADLEAFQKGSPAPADAELKRSIDEILKLIGGPKLLPHMLSYYETLRATSSLTPAQRILHQRTCRLVMANLKRHLENR